jgi:serine/threonine protein kinase
MSDWLGRYRIVRPLGEGGMGRVFLGEAAGPSGFHRRVVIKLVKDTLDPALAQALTDEARLAAKLVHRNIVPVLDFEEANGQRLVILEHVDGIDLGHLLSARRKLPWQIAVYVASEVAAGLDYAHRKTDDAGRPLGVVHRDVSPANILLSWEGEVKLTDFGVAQLARTVGGGLAGKRGYMAPEQARGEAVDARADLFALGAVLYEAVAGEPLGRGALAFDPPKDGGAGRALSGAPPKDGGAGGALSGAPSALVAVVARATAADAAARFASAAAMREALLHVGELAADPPRQLAAFLAEGRADRALGSDALYRAVLGGGRPPTRVRRDEPAPPHRRRAWWILGTSALATIALALAGWRIARKRPASPPPAIASAPGAPQASPPPESPPEHGHAAPRGRATLSINSIPWATIYVDGHPYGHTPRVNLPVAAGRHHLRLVTRDGDVRARVVDLPAGAARTVTVNFADP